MDAMLNKSQKNKGVAESSLVDPGRSEVNEAGTGSKIDTPLTQPRSPIDLAMARFVMWAMMEGSWQGCDIDGGAAQDKAVELGLIIEDQYDPKRHGESDCAEPGDCWFVPSEALLAVLASALTHCKRSTEQYQGPRQSDARSITAGSRKETQR